MNSSFIIKVKINVLIKWPHKLPSSPNVLMLSIELELLYIYELVV